MDENFIFVDNTPPSVEVKQLYGDEEVEQIVKERDEYKHRAEVAEKDLERHKRALNCACYDKARTYCPNDDWREVAKKFEHDYLQQAEREIEEEKND